MNALPHSELEARERLVDQAATDDFAELIRIAGLDPKKHLRFADWSGVDFSGCDLRGFDFTGSRLIGCNFRGALIQEARFDQALIDEARRGAMLDPSRTDLRKARDWGNHVNLWFQADRYVKMPFGESGWIQTNTPAPEHLQTGVVFQDAPFAPEMVVVPPGRFMMGSTNCEGEEAERPRHEVTIPQAFAVSRFPVTFDEWDAAIDLGGVEYLPSDSWGRGRQPVINVSWVDAKAYAAWLFSKTGKPYRLLSEAEWEYACRAGTDTAYFFGDSISKAQAQFRAARAVEVGSFPANNFGLCDMHGNVWEWCEDCWSESYAGKPESLNQTGGAWTAGDADYRVLRGGSWGGVPEILRSARCSRRELEARNSHFGFRVARTLPTS